MSATTCDVLFAIVPSHRTHRIPRPTLQWRHRRARRRLVAAGLHVERRRQVGRGTRAQLHYRAQHRAPRAALLIGVQSAFHTALAKLTSVLPARTCIDMLNFRGNGPEDARVLPLPFYYSSTKATAANAARDALDVDYAVAPPSLAPSPPHHRRMHLAVLTIHHQPPPLHVLSVWPRNAVLGIVGRWWKRRLLASCRRGTDQAH